MGRTASSLLILLMVLFAGPSQAQDGLEASPYDLVIVETEHDFDTAFTRLVDAVKEEGLIPVTRASASRAAAGRGIDIPGNGVVDAFNNHYAVRLLSASVAAGFEAPIRMYLTGRPDGTTWISYRRPTDLFSAYENTEVTAIAEELDDVFARLIASAAAAAE